MRLALGIEYDGSGFSGWQTQPGGRTGQDMLEAALARIAGASVRTVTAGRTDAGVHASGQVIHADIAIERPLSAWVRGTNSHLPAAIAVRWAQAVPDDFHARFSATGRHYRYVLLNRPVRAALLHGKVGWYHRPLDVAAMQRAARHLLGRHDFSAFRAAACQARTPVRELRRADVRRAGEFVVFDFAADAFLHHMVRNLVGALVYVGKGAADADSLADLLAAGERTLAPPTFAADGLYLVKVDYDAHWRLPDEPVADFPW